VWKPEGSNHLGDQAIDGDNIKMDTGSSWLSIGTGGGHL
jgi:hypothetical protein